MPSLESAIRRKVVTLFCEPAVLGRATLCAKKEPEWNLRI